MITVSTTLNWSKANWSWASTPILRGFWMVPVVGSCSPVNSFMKVDLPLPLGPVRP